MREHFERLQAAEQGRRTDDDADDAADDDADEADADEAAAAADAAADVPFARGHTSSAPLRSPLRSAALRSAPVHAFDPALASRGSGSGSGSGTDESAQV